MYHGTKSLQVALEISEGGFEMSKKNDGFKAATDVKFDYPDRHHFFSKSATMANDIARYQGGDEGAVVRVELPPEYRDTLTEDPAYYGVSLMSRYDTPASYVTDVYKVRPPEPDKS